MPLMSKAKTDDRPAAENFDIYVTYFNIIEITQMLCIINNIYNSVIYAWL